MRKSVIILLVFLFLMIVFFVVFPGRQAIIVIQLSTGFRINSLQERIDKLEEQAIKHKTFTTADRLFLHDFYSCLAKGAKLTFILRQSGQLMQHYLDGEGTPLRLNESIFKENKKVQKQMEQLRLMIVKDMGYGKGLAASYSSSVFYMPDNSNLDSIFGLYYGKIMVKPCVVNGKNLLLKLKWRAEVPWKWPSYDYLKKKYGTYHAESFPLPNLRSLLINKKYSLFVDNGLGAYLVTLGLAKPFLAYSEWEEEFLANQNIKK